MSKLVDLSEMRHGTELLKRGFAKMQEGGVIMDVVTPEQAHIAKTRVRQQLWPWRELRPTFGLTEAWPE